MSVQGLATILITTVYNILTEVGLNYQYIYLNITLKNPHHYHSLFDIKLLFNTQLLLSTQFLFGTQLQVTLTDNIWKSKFLKNLKIRLSIVACKSVLLYGSVTWTLTNAQEKRLDGTYTKMLRMVLGPHGRTRSAI